MVLQPPRWGFSVALERPFIDFHTSFCLFKDKIRSILFSVALSINAGGRLWFRAARVRLWVGFSSLTNTFGTLTKCPSFGNIARTHGCVRNDSETHETVLLDCTTGEAGSAIQ